MGSVRRRRSIGKVESTFLGDAGRILPNAGKAGGLARMYLFLQIKPYIALHCAVAAPSPAFSHEK